MGQDYQQVADQIDLIGRNVATFYEPVVADMHQVRMQTRQFADLTADLKSASDLTCDHSQFQQHVSIVDAVVTLRDAIGEARHIVSDDQLRAVLANMQSQCDQLARQSKELNSLSFLMLVTTASGADSGFSVEHLVSELREMATQLDSASSEILSTLTLVDGVRQDTGKVLSDTYELIDRSLGTIDVPGSALAGVGKSNSGTDTPERMADALSGDLAKLMPGLVACMQHPDAFAQRCDHVAQATRLLAEDLNEDTDVALRKIIAGQIDDICDELASIQADALHTLDRISQKGAETLERFGHHLANDTRLDQIAGQKKTISETSQKLTDINSLSQTALAELLDCVKQFDGVERIFLQLNAMREGVRTSSLNADLSERQAKINMPELRSVTKAVGECAAACGEAIDELGGFYREIHTAFGKVNEKAIGAAIAAVEKVLDASKAELDTISGTVENIRSATSACSSSLDQLTELGRSAHARIASNVMAGKQLKQIADDLCGAARMTTLVAENVDVSVMSRVFDTYTIETEREVHRRILPDVSEMKSDQDPGGSSDDEDPLAEFLF